MRYILVIFLVISSGCNFQEPKSQTEIAHLYVDILVAEEEFKSNSDSLTIVVDSLYSFYNINEQHYLEQLESFRYDVDTWDTFFNIAEEYLDTLKAIEKRKVN